MDGPEMGEVMLGVITSFDLKRVRNCGITRSKIWPTLYFWERSVPMAALRKKALPTPE